MPVQLTRPVNQVWQNGVEVDKDFTRTLAGDLIAAINLVEQNGRDAIKTFALVNVGGTGNAATAEKPPSQADIPVVDGSLVSVRWPATNTAINPSLTIGTTSFTTRRQNGFNIQPEEMVGGRHYLFVKHSATAMRLVSASGIPDILGLVEALADLTTGIGEGVAARVALRDASAIALVNLGGTANDITASLPEGLGLTSVPVGMPLALRGVGVNTGPVSLSINGAPALPVLDGRGRELLGGELSDVTPLLLRPSGGGVGGTHFRIMSALIHPADLALVAAAAASALQRAHHTGTQPISTVAGLSDALDGLSQASIDRDAAEAAARETADDALASALIVGGFVPLVDVGGTGDAITASLHPFAIEAGITIGSQSKAVLIPTAPNTGDVTLEIAGDVVRSVRDNAGNQLPGGFVQPGRFLLLGRHIAGAAGHWRVLNDVSRADLAAAVAELRGDLSISAAEVLTVAALADERAQAAGASAELNAAAIDSLLSRLAALEAGATAKDTAMTTYPISLTATAAPLVAVAAGPVQRLQLQNLAEAARIGLSFGAPAARFGASTYIIEPGGAIDTPLIAATPVYVMTDGGSAPIGGAFATPLHAPNPNWEADFQALLARLGGGASLTWIDAYRRLYSSLRRDGVLDRACGFYALSGHSQQAMLTNWAGDNAATIGAGTPVFAPKQGVLFDGASYLDTGVSMGALGVTTTTASAGVWPGFEDQAIGAAALGDGVFELHPNRSPTEAGVRGWSGSTSVDVAASPGLGSYLGAVRVEQPTFTIYAGGSGEIKERAYTSGYPVRPVFIGATNQSTGVGKHYSGHLRAALFGLSLTSVQDLAARAAVTRFLKDIEAA